MKTLYLTLCTWVLIGITTVSAQNQWPRSVNTPDGKLIKVYEWQPESASNGILQATAAVSVKENAGSEPVFGMAWLTASTRKSGNNLNVGYVNVTDVRFGDNIEEITADAVQQALQNAMSGWNLSFNEAQLNSVMNINQQQQQLAGQYEHTPPSVIYANRPSLLVVIDGAPRLQKHPEWNIETVVNTPFIIAKSGNKFYLHGGQHWYVANSATGDYAMTAQVPANLQKIQQEIIQANKDNNVEQEDKDYVISQIIVATKPTELIQSNGEAKFVPVQSTNLLYVSNTEDDIFMDVNSQHYYILLSGRWFKSTTLSGTWQFVASDQLPEGFGKIPKGSAKDNVLASVAGTIAADNAVMEAQVPQTARVDRRTASANIEYDGDPSFENIDGTDLSYAVNTPGQVIRSGREYYAVDNGVWFRANNPNGPWMVSDIRPQAIALVPPRYPVYGMKYVHIYDTTPDYIYMGYTPGYLNTYIYGPTVVYGTGYHYNPWFRSRYYARPFTWGFNMHYNPWTGWGFRFNYNAGWFYSGYRTANPFYNPWCGWWGPRVYRPVYNSWHMASYRNMGYYGVRNTVIVNNYNNTTIYRNNNIYNTRQDVVTRDNRRLVTNARTSNVRTSNGLTANTRTSSTNPSVRSRVAADNTRSVNNRTSSRITRDGQVVNQRNSRQGTTTNTRQAQQSNATRRTEATTPRTSNSRSTGGREATTAPRATQPAVRSQSSGTNTNQRNVQPQRSVQQPQRNVQPQRSVQPTTRSAPSRSVQQQRSAPASRSQMSSPSRSSQSAPARSSNSRGG